MSTHYSGLYKQAANSQLGVYIFSEEIKTRASGFNWEIHEHHHADLFQLFLFQKDRAEVFLADKKMDLQGPAYVFIPPGVHHGFKYTENIEGRILTFSSYFLQHLMHEHNFKQIGATAQTFHGAPLAPKDYDTMVSLIRQADREIFHNLPGRFNALQFIFGLLLLELDRIKSHFNQPLTQANKHLDYYQAFVGLVNQHNNPFVSLQTYADAIHISQSHLNRVCRAMAGKSSLQVIHEITLNRAKSLLQHTTYGIAEVAFRSGFEDASYFIRFFKKHTGLTPQAFRVQEIGGANA